MPEKTLVSIAIPKLTIFGKRQLVICIKKKPYWRLIGHLQYSGKKLLQNFFGAKMMAFIRLGKGGGAFGGAFMVYPPTSNFCFLCIFCNLFDANLNFRARANVLDLKIPKIFRKKHSKNIEKNIQIYGIFVYFSGLFSNFQKIQTSSQLIQVSFYFSHKKLTKSDVFFKF